MDQDIADLLPSLREALRRLAQRSPSRTEHDQAAEAQIRQAQAHIEQAIAALIAAGDAAAKRSPEVIAAPPSASRLADRIVLIDTPAAAEPFRTRIKIKATEASEAPAPAAAGETPSFPVPPAAAHPPQPAVTDDLTRIRGIDRALARRLDAHGVSTFAAIAGWSHADVRRISAALDLGRQISRQSWIEQAALLAPSPPAPQPHARAPAAAPPAAETAAEPVLAAAPVVEALAAAPLAAVTPAPVIETVDAVADGAAPLPVDPPAAEVDTTEVVAAAEPVAAPIIEPAPAAPPDRLDLICGLNADAAMRLAAAGVTQWRQIAAWRRADLEQFAPVVGCDAATLARQGWIEQAAVLAAGRLTSHAQRVANGDFAAVVERPADEILPLPHLTPWQPPAPSQEPAAPLTMTASVEDVAEYGIDVDPSLFAVAPREVVETVEVAEPVEVVATTEPVAVTDGDARPAAPVAEHQPTEKATPPSLRTDAVTPDTSPTTTAALESASPPLPAFEPADRVTPPRPVSAPSPREPSHAEPIALDFAVPAAQTTAAPAASPSAPDEPVPLRRFGHVEDEEFPELSVGEAEVAIIRRSPPPSPTRTPLPARRPERPVPSAHSLLSRLRRTAPIDDIDPSTYAAYRDQVGEASVEIVKPQAK